jgi:hypothetical protein
MKRIIVAFSSLALWFLASCFFGDAVVHKTVSVSLPSSAQQTNVALSVRDAQVHEALKTIESVLVANGYSSDPRELTSADRARGLVAFYGICGVMLSSNRVDIGFLESHRRHFSRPVSRVIGQLEERLNRQYGTERVKIAS